MVSETQQREADACLLGLFDDIDMGRHDGLARYFSGEAVFRFAQSRQSAKEGDYHSVQGAENIAEFLQAAFSSLAATHHAISNLRTTVEGGAARSSAHMRVYHQGAGPVAHLFEESLSVCDVMFGNEDGQTRITHFSYIILIILGTTEVFTALQDQA